MQLGNGWCQGALHVGGQSGAVIAPVRRIVSLDQTPGHEGPPVPDG
jgi:hypothetical protein